MPSLRFPGALWFCLALLAMGSASLAAATNPIARTSRPIETWQTDDGLPQSSVFSIVQTRDGYLWLGTLNGLARFDGVRFTVFDESNTPGLNDSRIMHLFEDSRGTLWVGTESGGIAMMRDGRVVTPADLPAGGTERLLRATAEDQTGAAWLYFDNGEVWRYAEERFTPFVIVPPEPSRTRTMIVETNGPLWVGTARSQLAVEAGAESASLELPVRERVPVNGFLERLVASRAGGYWRLANARVERWSTNQLQQVVTDYQSFLEARDGWFGGATAAAEDAAGNLLFGTASGLFIISTNGQVATVPELANLWILSLFVDREGTLWVGTDGGGLIRVQREVFDMIEPTLTWTINSVAADGAGGVWIGSHGKGVGYWRTNALAQFAVGNNYAKSVFVDREGAVWIGTAGAGGLFRSQGGAFLPVNPPLLAHATVQAILQDRAGAMWFGTQSGLVRSHEGQWTTFTARDGLTSEHVTALAEGHDGAMWIGTRRGGLQRWHHGKFTSFRRAEGAPSDDIAGVLVDAEGVVWVTTFANGLARFANAVWTHYTRRDGLVSNNLGYLIEEDGNLWIGSNAGVLRVPKKALNDFAAGAAKSVPCRSFGRNEGLATGECTTGSQPGTTRSADGTLWFSTIRGVAALHPAKLPVNTNPPPVVISAVQVDDEPVTAHGAEFTVPPRVVLNPGDDRLEIFYSSVNLAAPDRARFRYRLDGYEKEWTEAGNSRVARYPNLPPGEYTFHVTAANEDGVWNANGSRLPILVRPPFWRTWWFIAATAAVVLGLVAGIVHLVSTQRLQRQLAAMRQQEALEKERARIARDIHDQVGASLTQVALLGELLESDKESPTDVESHAQQITQTARETTRALDEIVWTVNPQNDTLEGLVNYIAKNAQDYLAVAGVRYRFDLPAELPARPIPPDVRHNVFLASKEAITNVVRHAKATEVWVRLRVEPRSFVIEIEDNGRGVAGLDINAPRTRHGLKNMLKRMEDIGGRFELVPGASGGALARLTIPLAPAPAAPAKATATVS